LGSLLAEDLDAQGIEHDLAIVSANTRGDFLLLDREKGVITEVPESPTPTTPVEEAHALDRLRRGLNLVKTVVIADDGLDGGAESLIDRAVFMALQSEATVIMEVSGGGLFVARERGAFAVRVSLTNLQKQTETSLRHDSAIIAEARTIIAQGVQYVIVTLGEEGAILVDGSHAWRVKAPIVSHFNPTGSGETLTGAFAQALQADWSVLDAVRWGCAAASVNVTHDAPGYATPGEVNVLYPHTTATMIGFPAS
jgi:tagatose 6-phosphate kinase